MTDRSDRGRRAVRYLLLICIVSASSAAAQSEDWRGYPAGEWPLAGGHWGHTRHSTLNQITTSNIADLGGAWVAELDGEVSRSTPVVRNGLMFVTTSTSVRALDAKTGEARWTHRASVGRMNKGAAVGAGLVFAGLNDSTLIALDEQTGELVWSHRIGDDDVAGQVITAPPAYANGLVISGMANGDSFLRGRVVALDVETGDEVWRFQTIPAPGQRGSETWPTDSDVWRWGGAGVWMTPTLDVDLGLAYIGTGNAVPMWGGELRAGDNLFSVSVVALDLNTGEYKWHQQLVHHDLWEHDLGTPLIVYDATVDGETRRVVAAMRTDGYLFRLDAKTGAHVFPVEERPVKQNAFLKTSPTQPFPVGADRIGPDCTPTDLIPPGFAADCYFDPIPPERHNSLSFTSMRFAPMAYSPLTGYFYGMACVYPKWRQRPASGWFWTSTGRLLAGVKTHGFHVALDSRTNRIVWQYRVPYADCMGSGAMTTAGGLMFHAEADGNLGAFDQTTGDQLWRFQTGFIGVPNPRGYGGGPVVTYEIDGEQFVALAMNRVVWAFTLDGTLPPRPAPTPPPTAVPFQGPIADTNTIELGNLIVQENRNTGRRDEWHDEYGLVPGRTRVTAGTTVTWVNTTTLTHTVAARDGSWSTGRIAPEASASVVLDTPGTYEYVCHDHLWTVGQLIVE